MLKEISPIINKLSQGKNLTVDEAEKAFDICIKEDKEGCFFTALNMGLMAKGITSDELLGFYKSKQKLLPKIEIGISKSEITDNSGSGGDKIKTFNISTTAAFVIAAADIPMAKQSFFAVTGIGGSGDLFRFFGIDVIQNSNEKSIKNNLEKVGFAPYIAGFIPSQEKIQGYLTFVKRIMEDGLTYLTPYHLAVNILSPIEIKRRIYGVFDKKYIKVIAELLQKVGYEKALIVYGSDGLDEISNIGDTEIVELDNGTIKSYILTPKDFGVEKTTQEKIKAISKEQNVIDFLKILYNKEKGPKQDIVLMNASAVFYVMGKVKTFKEGILLAERIINESGASKKFEEVVGLMGDVEKLNKWKKISKI